MSRGDFPQLWTPVKAKFALQIARYVRTAAVGAHVEAAPGARASARKPARRRPSPRAAATPSPRRPGPARRRSGQSSRSKRVRRRAGGGAVAPEARLLRVGEEVGDVAHARDRAGARRRPAEALQTAGVTSAARRSGITTPSAPATSAVRQTAPRFCGSCTSSRTITRLGGLREQLARAGVRIGLGLRDDALVGIGARARRQLARPWPRWNGTATGPRLVAQTW